MRLLYRLSAALLLIGAINSIMGNGKYWFIYLSLAVLYYVLGNQDKDRDRV